MRIAFNATCLLSPLTGIGQYALHLSKGLQAREDIELKMFYGVGWSKEIQTKPLPQYEALKKITKSLLPNAYSLRRWFLQKQFNKGLKGANVDLYHDPNFLAFPFDGPSVVTVHDLSWIRFPETHPKDRVDAMNRHFEPAMKAAKMIITDSIFVKNELIETFGIENTRIKNIPLGAEELFKPLESQETFEVLNILGLMHQNYILAVGTLEPRKNLQVAIFAYMRLPVRIRKKFPLVVVGMKGWHTSALEKQMAPLIASGEIRLLGYLKREELAIVIAGALTLVYPSIYEGFGLPPLEAMSCGVPVIASNVSSLPEVVGDTGFLVNPQDINGISEAIEVMISTPELRQELSNKAVLKSADYSWNICVDQTIAVYQDVLSNRV